MKTNKRVSTVLAAALLALSLGACGSGGLMAPPEDVAVIEIEVQQPFEGRVIRGTNELETITNSALDLAMSRKDSVKSDAEESTFNEKVNKDFKAANEAYNNGEYETAQTTYESILETYPLHYGANVNLTLALLQQEKAEEALLQSLECCYLFPKQGEPLLNVQAAGVACGFSTTDLEDAMEKLITVANGDFDDVKNAMSEEYETYYAYNRVWADMEYGLYEAAHEGAADEQGATADEDAAASDADAAATEEGVEAEASEEERIGGLRSRYYDYAAMYTQLFELENTLPGDTDIPALRAYLYAVGLQLGYQVDPNLIDPVHTMPFVAVDDALGKIEFKEVTQDASSRTIAGEFTNKLESVTLELTCQSEWMVDGEETTVVFASEKAAPGAVVGFTIVLGNAGASSDTATADAESGEASAGATLESFSGELDLQTDEGMIARYPVSWTAAEAGE